MNEHPCVMQEYENVVVVRFGKDGPGAGRARRRIRFSEVAFGLLLLSVLVGSGAALTGTQPKPAVRSVPQGAARATVPCHQPTRLTWVQDLASRLSWLNTVAMMGN